MKFFCLSMSPALDVTVTIPSAPKGEGEIFKDVAEEINVGGKGINVARWLAVRGADVTCGGLLGEDNDRLFVQELQHCGIRDCFKRIPGVTRTNEMIVWPGGAVKLNRPAFPSLKWAELLDELMPHESEPGVAILSGSLPPSVPKDFYFRAILELKKHGWVAVLDASGEALVHGVDAFPDLIKPNAEECSAMTGFVPKSPEDFKRATQILQAKAKSVIISDGGAGAWFDGEFVAAPPVDVVDTTAAGDTLLAEYCWRKWEAHDSNAAYWAVAAGSAACTMPGGAPPVGRISSISPNLI